MLKAFDRKFKQVINKLHKEDGDPLRELGPGISTYHQLLLLLVILFFFLTVLHIPVYNTLSKYNFYDDSFFNQYSLGNLGFSKTECNIGQFVLEQKQALKCKSGVIVELVDFGVTTNFED